MIPVDELTQLLSPTVLDQLAVSFCVNQANQVRLPGQTVFVCLLNGLLNHPQLTQRLLAGLYHQQTGRTVDRTSFAKRLLRLPPASFAALF